MKATRKGLWLLALTCISFFAFGISNVSAEKYGDYLYYTEENGEITITKCNDSAQTVEIPAFIDEKPVTSIGKEAFFWCDNLTSVTIPNTVRDIGESAFYSCIQLADITFPESLTTIGDHAFDKCNALTSVTIPGNILNIGEYAFTSCDALTSVTVQDGVKSIGLFAFDGCGSLENITLPDSLTEIADQAFYGTAYYNDEQNRENGVLYIGNHLIKAESTVSGEYVVKPGTKVIADCAFYYCSDLTQITLPDSLTAIGSRAFGGCSGLVGMTIPKNVTHIGAYAFQACVHSVGIEVAPDNTAYLSEDGVLYNKDKTEILYYPIQKTESSFVIPDSVTRIADAAFDSCQNLKSVTIPSGLTSVGNHAFADCGGLTDITLPDGVVSIGADAFFDCKNLISATIPNSIRSIGEYAFYSSGIKLVFYIGDEEDWAAVTKGSYHSIRSVIYSRGISALRSYDDKLYVKPIKIESGIFIVAFYDGDKLIETRWETYNGTEIIFSATKDYTFAKVMLCENLYSLKPLAAAVKR